MSTYLGGRVNAAETIRAAAAVPVDAVTLTLDRAELQELVNELDELAWLREEESAREMREQAPKQPEFRPANGHWFVEDGSYTCVGEIADLDAARVRVALQRALPDACKAVLALTGRQSVHDLVSAALSAVARHYGVEPLSRPDDALQDLVTSAAPIMAELVAEHNASRGLHARPGCLGCLLAGDVARVGEK